MKKGIILKIILCLSLLIVFSMTLSSCDVFNAFSTSSTNSETQNPLDTLRFKVKDSINDYTLKTSDFRTYVNNEFCYGFEVPVVLPIENDTTEMINYTVPNVNAVKFSLQRMDLEFFTYAFSDSYSENEAIDIIIKGMLTDDNICQNRYKNKKDPVVNTRISNGSVTYNSKTYTKIVENFEYQLKGYEENSFTATIYLTKIRNNYLAFIFTDKSEILFIDEFVLSTVCEYNSKSVAMNTDQYIPNNNKYSSKVYIDLYNKDQYPTDYMVAQHNSNKSNNITAPMTDFDCYAYDYTKNTKYDKSINDILSIFKDDISSVIFNLYPDRKISSVTPIGQSYFITNDSVGSVEVQEYIMKLNYMVDNTNYDYYAVMCIFKTNKYIGWITNGSEFVYNYNFNSIEDFSKYRETIVLREAIDNIIKSMK